MASMNPRGSSFIVRWRAGSKGKWQTCTFHDENDAKRAQKLATAHKHKISDTEVYAIVLELDEKGQNDEEEEALTPLVGDWIEDWLEGKVDVAKSTKTEYARMLRGKWISQPVGDLPPLAKMRIGELHRAKHVDPWKAGLSETLMPAGVRKHWAVMSMVLRDATPRYRLDNPFDRPSGQRTNGLPTIEHYDAYFLTVEEAEILLAACPPHIRDLVVVALGTGMRLSELLGLRVKAVSLNDKNPVVYVEKTLSRTGGLSAPKSRKSRRPIPLAARVVEVLTRLVAGKNRNDFVFTSPAGKPWDANNFRNREWRYVVARAQRCAQHPPKTRKAGNGSELDQVKSLAVSTCDCATRLHQRPRSHDLRHSFVAYLIAAGFDFLAIQQIVGHASIKTTFDTYGHRLAQHDQKLLAKLNKMLPRGAKVADFEEFERKRRKKSKKGAKREVAPFIAGLKLAA
ncbi:tyrosine-type recombinase/integrase [Actinoplanes aureus]|uniref:Site-specific integrase n=1 Tax=Actinoplanes aureus TaxID=2792083 RepID=A0A931CMZ6_9ACTN|nr:site-specific integrase [Actinoplanes aureus]MBG0569328.1 site-specific integrase [Actinoplanes aureus]